MTIETYQAEQERTMRNKIGDELYDTFDAIQEFCMIHGAIERYRNGMDKETKRPTKVQLSGLPKDGIRTETCEENEKPVPRDYPVYY